MCIAQRFAQEATHQLILIHRQTASDCDVLTLLLCVQGFAVLMLIPLLFIVPKGDGAQSSSTRAGVAAVVLTPAAENGDAPLPNGTACQNGTSLHNGEMAAGFSEAAAHAAGAADCAHILCSLRRSCQHTKHLHAAELLCTCRALNAHEGSFRCVAVNAVVADRSHAPCRRREHADGQSTFGNVRVWRKHLHPLTCLVTAPQARTC